jgi:hypothetical protein
MATISIPNTDKSNGSADFTLRIAAGEKPLQVRQISGNASWQKAADALRSTPLPLRIPDAAAVEIPLRGTLSCKPNEVQCRFSFLSSEDAVDLARNEAAIDTSSTTETAAVDPHIYNDPAMGMRISLPDEWRLVKEVPGSFSQPHSAVFGKPGAIAFFTLAREHLEGTPDLYKKMLESSLLAQTLNETGKIPLPAMAWPALAGVLPGMKATELLFPQLSNFLPWATTIIE